MAKHLFIDDRFVAETSGLTRRFHEARKCDRNPVIRADRPWEKDAAFIDSAMVVYDEAAGRFRAWYQGGACYGPDDGSNMCYATSADGIGWHKPSLGVVDFEGSADNNIVLAATCMMHDPAPIIDPADPDPLRRYKAVWWGGRLAARPLRRLLRGRHPLAGAPRQPGLGRRRRGRGPVRPGAYGRAAGDVLQRRRLRHAGHGPQRER